MVLELNIRTEKNGEHLDVTSNHLEPIISRSGALEDMGDELSKRVDNFGFPVGKSMFSPLCYPWSSLDSLSTDDPNTPPVLIARIGKGQEIKARCIAKKVNTRCTVPFVRRLTKYHIGYSKRAC